MTDMALGTPDFVAPESLESGVVVDHRADLYAVGVMFYQMLTGSVPRGNFKSPSGKVDGIDPRLDAIVARAMEADPDDRYSSAAEFRAAIDEVLTNPVPVEQHTGAVKAKGPTFNLVPVEKKATAATTTTAEQSEPIRSQTTRRQPKKKNPAVLAAAIAVPLVAVAIGAIVLMGGKDGEEEVKEVEPREIAKEEKSGGEARALLGRANGTT
jgi:serine/threonine protein kinase